MTKKPNIPFDDELGLPQPSPADLRGRQSVRATFKLTPKSIEMLSIVSGHLGIKQKSLFDHLIEDIQSLHVIAQAVKMHQFARLHRTQKTYVLSRKTLLCLDQTSKKTNAPRDALVEYSIQRLLPVIAQERAKHRKRIKVLAEYSQLTRKMQRFIKHVEDELGPNDPINTRLEMVKRSCIGAQLSIAAFIEKGEIIEEFIDDSEHR